MCVLSTYELHIQRKNALIYEYGSFDKETHKPMEMFDKLSYQSFDAKRNENIETKSFDFLFLFFNHKKRSYSFNRMYGNEIIHSHKSNIDALKIAHKTK